MYIQGFKVCDYIKIRRKDYSETKLQGKLLEVDLECDLESCINSCCVERVKKF
jgi:hypothetical protein